VPAITDSPYRHQDEKLGAGQPRQIGADHQLAFDIAQEHRGRRAQAHRAAQFETALQDKGKPMYDGRQHAPIPQDGGQRADHHQQWQERESQIDHVGGMGDGEGRRAAADIAENKAGARTRRGGKRAHHVIEPEQQVANHRHFQQQQRQGALQQQGPRHHAPIKSLAVFRQSPGNRDQDGNSQQRLSLRQSSPRQTSRLTLHDFLFPQSKKLNMTEGSGEASLAPWGAR